MVPRTGFSRPVRVSLKPAGEHRNVTSLHKFSKAPQHNCPRHGPISPIYQGINLSVPMAITHKVDRSQIAAPELIRPLASHNLNHGKFRPNSPHFDRRGAESPLARAATTSANSDPLGGDRGRSRRPSHPTHRPAQSTPQSGHHQPSLGPKPNVRAQSLTEKT